MGKEPDVEISGETNVDVDLEVKGLKAPKSPKKSWGFKGPDLHMPDIDINLPKFGFKGKGSADSSDAELNIEKPDVDLEVKKPNVDADLKEPDFNISGGTKVDVDLEIKGHKSTKPKRSWSFKGPDINLPSLKWKSDDTDEMDEKKKTLSLKKKKRISGG